MRQQYEFVAFETERFFLSRPLSMDSWNDYWEMLELFGWQYMEYMKEMEQRITQEWGNISQCTN